MPGNTPDLYRRERHGDRRHGYKRSVATATQSRSPRLRRGAVRLRPWNGDLSLLRGTHHDPDLSRPEVQPEQRCCFQCSAPCSCLPRSESRSLTSARRPLSSPAEAGLFLWLIRLQDRAVLPSNVQTKRRRRGTQPRQSQHQSAPHQLPPASTPPVAAPDHRTRPINAAKAALSNQGVTEPTTDTPH